MTVNFILGNATIDKNTPVETVVLIAQGQVEFWRKRCERMEKALREIVEVRPMIATIANPQPPYSSSRGEITYNPSCQDIARQALSEEGQ